jgi:hypothetical protein
MSINELTFILDAMADCLRVQERQINFSVFVVDFDIIDILVPICMNRKKMMLLTCRSSFMRE